MNFGDSEYDLDLGGVFDHRTMSDLHEFFKDAARKTKRRKDTVSKVLELLEADKKNSSLPLEWIAKIAVMDLGYEEDLGFVASVVAEVKDALLLERIRGKITL